MGVNLGLKTWQINNSLNSYWILQIGKNRFLSGLVASECAGAGTVIVLTCHSTDIVLNGLSTLLLLVLAWLLCEQALDWLLCLLVLVWLLC